MTTSFDVMKEGGNWLGATREYLQCHAVQGSDLIWGSEMQVRGLTVREIEELAADAVAADRKQRGL